MFLRIVKILLYLRKYEKAITLNKKSVSAYITPEGQKRLKSELSYLWKVKRPQVTLAVAEAAAMGDRSENAEYIYGKKQLRQIDSRIRFLAKRLSELIVVDRTPDDTSKIFFGAWVEVEDTDGNVSEYRIVGPDESDSEKNFISIDSPMAKALLRRAEGDEIVVSRPKGKAAFVVTSVHY
ncbi:MAG: transcription elongation factor GreB [Nitrospirae bacterium]|nr:transcription elongation factor GreB [Nitrospirota bacterium]